MKGIKKYRERQTRETEREKYKQRQRDVETNRLRKRDKETLCQVQNYIICAWCFWGKKIKSFVEIVTFYIAELSKIE
jgi:hypothetical protein